MKLDVSSLPRVAFYGSGDEEIELATIVLELGDTILLWERTSMIIANDSFGFAMANPFVDVSLLWDDPYKFTWFTSGWGPDADRYIANAVRKLRAALRLGRDTLDLRITDPNAFIDIVDEQEPDGSFEWGDFPWGGATFVRVGDLVLPSAVSCLNEVEDDVVAKTISGHVGAKMLKLRDSAEFA